MMRSKYVTICCVEISGCQQGITPLALWGLKRWICGSLYQPIIKMNTQRTSIYRQCKNNTDDNLVPRGVCFCNKSQNYKLENGG